MKWNLFWLAGLPMLAACASDRVYGPDSPHYRFPMGTHITLQRPITIPADEASVRLQFGQAVARNGVQEQEPHCIFEVERVLPQPQTVAADNFSVTRAQRHISSFSGMPAGLFWFGRTQPSHIYYITEFRLHSDRQPGVRSLTCQSNQAAAGISMPRHLTLAEMREALGDWFSLALR